jgi:ATP-dependent Clp protease ATP-binding subunit ClpA
MGARPMKRVIQEQIKRQLADDLLFGNLAQGGEVTVDVSGDEDGLEISACPREEGQKALPASTS